MKLPWKFPIGPYWQPQSHLAQRLGKELLQRCTKACLEVAVKVLDSSMCHTNELSGYHWQDSPQEHCKAGWVLLLEIKENFGV